MALTSMKDMLKKAKSENYAVGAFNIVDENSTAAVIEAAEELKSPVIIQTSVKTVKLYGAKPIAAWTHALANSSQIPIALHLDHCKEIAVLRECVEAGWTDVMFDGSALLFEENIAKTKEAVSIAHPKGVGVEGELGAIVGVEDDIHVKEQDSHLADPEQSEKFVKETKIDFFAPAIGTAHGIYKGEPKIDFDLLCEIAKRVGIPIAIHGGTGLSKEIFNKCIHLGGAKVNVSTQIKHTYKDSYEKYFKENPQDYEPVKVVKYVHDNIKKTAKEFIKIFGSEGKC